MKTFNTLQARKKYLTNLDEDGMEYLASRIEDTTDFRDSFDPNENIYDQLIKIPAKFFSQAVEYIEDENEDWEEFDDLLNIDFTKIESIPEVLDDPIPVNSSKSRIIKKLSSEYKNDLIFLAHNWNQQERGQKVSVTGFKKDIASSFNKIERNKLVTFLFSQNRHLFSAPSSLKACKNVMELLLFVDPLEDSSIRKIIAGLKNKGYKFRKKKSDEDWSDLLADSFKTLNKSDLFEEVESG